MRQFGIIEPSGNDKVWWIVDRHFWTKNGNAVSVSSQIEVWDLALSRRSEVNAIDRACNRQMSAPR
ncbi:hypothetical protein GFL84_13965 [Rhizobium leguminosarum bv. viciae]|nr:hypothetical protein [Rhizobium leguminosarum bv. viciae]